MELPALGLLSTVGADSMDVIWGRDTFSILAIGAKN